MSDKLRVKKRMDNYPMGAANDPAAPYNQAYDVEQELDREYMARHGIVKRKDFDDLYE